MQHQELQKVSAVSKAFGSRIEAVFRPQRINFRKWWDPNFDPKGLFFRVRWFNDACEPWADADVTLQLLTDEKSWREPATEKTCYSICDECVKPFFLNKIFPYGCRLWDEECRRKGAIAVQATPGFVPEPSPRGGGTTDEEEEEAGVSGTIVLPGPPQTESDDDSLEEVLCLPATAPPTGIAWTYPPQAASDDDSAEGEEEEEECSTGVLNTLEEIPDVPTAESHTAFVLGGSPQPSLGGGLEEEEEGQAPAVADEEFEAGLYETEGEVGDTSVASAVGAAYEPEEGEVIEGEENGETSVVAGAEAAVGDSGSDDDSLFGPLDEEKPLEIQSGGPDPVSNDEAESEG